MILYYAPGACSLAVHIALEEVGADYEARAIDLAAGQQTGDDYLKINPRGRVPALILDDQLVTEVPALLTYVASLNPDAGLVPAPGSLAFARCFEWLGFLSSTVHVAYAQFRRPQRFVPPDTPLAEQVSAHGRDICIALWKEIDGKLGPEWAAGAPYSIADPYLLPFYTWSWRMDLDARRDLPNWTQWVRRIAQRPAVQRVLADEALTLDI
jgi:glutathione S-transferase